MATITVTNDELNLIKAALTEYRLKGFPLGRSSYGNPISNRDRQEWAAFGMQVWQKVTDIKEEEVKL